MTDLNQYLLNKDHDTFFTGGGITPVIGGKPLLIGGSMIAPSQSHSSIDDKLKFTVAAAAAKIKPSISRERVGLNANQLLINLQNYNFKPLMMGGAHKRQFSDAQR
jgi:hypothetical protein